jgi:SAM-dependent methyltransferase
MRQPAVERLHDSLRLRALDLKDRLNGRSDRLVPPRRLDFVGHSDFVDTGDEFLAHFVELGGLQPGHRVLDVGCGIGRMARPLTGYLSAQGSYDGFDVNREGIGWCRRRYGRFANFHFKTADLFNKRYNPAGARAASEYVFPYEDETFDFAICASVLTHLLEDEVEQYLAQLRRVLRPGGRALTTWFLLEHDARARIAAGQSGLPFIDPENHVAVVSEDMPEEAVAYDEGWVYDQVGEADLEIVEPVHPGSWCGREDARSFQDLVVLQRP